jgi:hypothetical protein
MKERKTVSDAKCYKKDRTVQEGKGKVENKVVIVQDGATECTDERRRKVDKQTDRRTNRRTNRQNEQTDRQTDRNRQAADLL